MNEKPISHVFELRIFLKYSWAWLPNPNPNLLWVRRFQTLHYNPTHAIYTNLKLKTKWCYGFPGGRHGGGHSLVSSVPMRDQKKNDEKGYFFSRRAVRSADII